MIKYQPEANPRIIDELFQCDSSCGVHGSRKPGIADGLMPLVSSGVLWRTVVWVWHVERHERIQDREPPHPATVRRCARSHMHFGRKCTSPGPLWHDSTSRCRQRQ